MKLRILDFLISITLIFSPLYLIRCKNFSLCVSPIPFTLLEVLILATFFTWFFLKYKKKKNIKKIIEEIRTRIPLLLQIFILIFLLATVITILFSPDKFSGLGFYKAYFIEPVLFFIVLLDYLSEKKTLRLVFWSLIASGVWISLIAIFEKIINYSPFNYSEFFYRGRVGSIYNSSNAVGLLVGPLIVVLIGYCFYLIKEKEKEKEKELIFGIKGIYSVIFALVIMLVGLYFSGSRGAMLGIFAGIFFIFNLFLFNKIKKKIIKKTIIKIILALIIIFFITNFIFLFNIKSVIEANKSSNIFPQIQPRLCIWESAIKIIKNKPLIGSGLGGFVVDNPNYQTCNKEIAHYPHNIFLNFWVETGIFGLISFIFLCGWFFFRLITFEKIDYLRLGLAGFFISLFFHGLLDVPYLKNDLSLVFWTILAICLYLINEVSLFKVKVHRV